MTHPRGAKKNKKNKDHISRYFTLLCNETDLFQPLQVVGFVDVHSCELFILREVSVYKAGNKAVKLFLAVTDDDIRAPDHQLGASIRVTANLTRDSGRLLQHDKRRMTPRPLPISHSLSSPTSVYNSSFLSLA